MPLSPKTTTVHHTKHYLSKKKRTLIDIILPFSLATSYYLNIFF